MNKFDELNNIKSKEFVKEYVECEDYSYDKYVKYLINKYGVVEKDYYPEISYNNALLNGNSSKLNNKRNKSEKMLLGLFKHHIKENISPNIGNPSTILEKEYPFEYQKKENLVYCTLFEHSLLHFKILLESKDSSSNLGYDNLMIQLRNYYIDGHKPSPETYESGLYNIIYHSSFLLPEDYIFIVKAMEKKYKSLK